MGVLDKVLDFLRVLVILCRSVHGRIPLKLLSGHCSRVRFRALTICLIRSMRLHRKRSRAFLPHALTHDDLSRRVIWGCGVSAAAKEDQDDQVA